VRSVRDLLQDRTPHDGNAPQGLECKH
jgi:hypothetical protein